MSVFPNSESQPVHGSGCPNGQLHPKMHIKLIEDGCHVDGAVPMKGPDLQRGFRSVLGTVLRLLGSSNGNGASRFGLLRGSSGRCASPSCSHIPLPTRDGKHKCQNPEFKLRLSPQPRTSACLHQPMGNWIMEGDYSRPCSHRALSPKHLHCST